VAENRFLHLIEVFASHEVRFIVVGGVAAVLQRVPVNTEDFDLVYDRAKDNIPRLLAALRELRAVYRDDPRNVLSLEKLIEIKRQLPRPKDKFFDLAPPGRQRSAKGRYRHGTLTPPVPVALSFPG
jgi:hypothetical protein